MSFLKYFLIWQEVWALLIPFTIIAIYKPAGKQLRLIVWYVILGFILNFIAIFMLVFYYLVPDWMHIDGMVNNNILYNIHSVIRVLLFSLYIIAIRQYRYAVILKIILVTFLVLTLTNFIFIESPFFLSTPLFTAESIVLLAMCFSYFFQSIQDESDTNWLRHPSFLVCAAISLYEVITFFIFLFFYPLTLKDPSFHVVTMQIYSITYILLCILLALAFYQSKKQTLPER